MYNNELYHFGIKGQKWGIRRFQNSDGSLTSAGKERYGSGLGNKIKEGAKSVGGKVSRAAGKAAKLGASAAVVGVTSGALYAAQAIKKIGVISTAVVGAATASIGEKASNRALKVIGSNMLNKADKKIDAINRNKDYGLDASSLSKRIFKKSAIGHEYYTRKGQKAYESNQALINELKKRRPHYF